jgi:alkylation response protein AidB-like acyl-CoA dehydrogenase
MEMANRQEITPEAALVADAVRGLLSRYWPAEQAANAAGDPAAVRASYRILVDQGFGEFGRGGDDGGAAEAAIVAAELGRAHCPAPLLDRYLLNFAASAPGGERLDALLGGAPATLVAAEDSGGFHVADGRARGHLELVEQAAACDAVVVLTRTGEVAVVRAEQLAVIVSPVTALSLPGFARLEFADAAADIVRLAPSVTDDLASLSRLLHTARAQGAARRAFELVVGYAKTRHQFGQPIGRFQAVAHKLANCHIALTGAELLIRRAAAEKDAESADWRYCAAAASAFAGLHLPRFSVETHHVFGAIGYSEEHEAPRHFKRVHVDLLAAGGGRAARRELAERVTAASAPGLPKLDLGPAGNQFRQEVRAWLDQHWSDERRAAHNALTYREREFDRQFALRLGETGWIGAGWPAAFGGQARSPLEQLAFLEEMEMHDAPRFGAPVHAALLMLYGTQAQRDLYLPEILRGRAMFGIGYSEPDAGSDLASLRTRAVRDGDDWVVNGQKIWTTTYWGEYMLLAARTDPGAPSKHAGVSLFILPMTAPGITVKVDSTMYSGTFANIFYDDVRVPADALVGTLNDGWKVLVSALAAERGTVGGGVIVKVAHMFDLICAELTRAGCSDDPVIRDALGGFAAEIEAGRQLMLACADAAAELGDTPPDLAAVSKVHAGELMERMLQEALEIMGPAAAIGAGEPGAVLSGRLEQALRHSLMWVISMGTNEIQRSLIAQRALGLPR